MRERMRAGAAYWCARWGYHLFPHSRYQSMAAASVHLVADFVLVYADVVYPYSPSLFHVANYKFLILYNMILRICANTKCQENCVNFARSAMRLRSEAVCRISRCESTPRSV